MIVTVDPAAPEPPYEQVRRAIVDAVASGVLGPGARLPTVRELAGSLALAANTVARAYRELETAGVVVTQGRRGTFVSDPPGDATAEARAAAADYARRCSELGIAPADALTLVRAALGLGT